MRERLLPGQLATSVNDCFEEVNLVIPRIAYLDVTRNAEQASSTDQPTPLKAVSGGPSQPAVTLALASRKSIQVRTARVCRLLGKYSRYMWVPKMLSQ